MVKRKSFHGLILFLVTVLVGIHLQAASPAPKTLTLTGIQAENLYKNLIFVAPDANSAIKNAYISVIQECDGPGPFTYFAVYSPVENHNRTYKMESQNLPGMSESESLFLDLFADGNGLTVHDNAPIFTQTIIDFRAKCVGVSDLSHNYSCTIEQ